MTMVPNKPTEIGRALGKQLARLCDAAETEQRKHFPDMQERCKTCAFRGGSLPNGCEETVMDAIKCVIEGVGFMCHHSPKDGKGGYTELCQGWFLLVSQQKEYGKAPWPFSQAESSDTRTSPP